jgi:hypothetical protein
LVNLSCSLSVLCVLKCTTLVEGDGTTVVGLITNNDETAYREEVRALGVW